MTETEIKLRWHGTAEEAQALIERQGYTLSTPRTLEADQLFDLLSGGLRQSDQLLRLRKTNSPLGNARAMVTYKGPATREVYKSREEIEFDVSDPDAFVLVLQRLGYRPSFRYEKYRTQLIAAGEPGLIAIDETPIGVFLELEGEKEWIDSTATLLGFPVTQFVTASYAALYKEYQTQNGNSPVDMTFGLGSPYESGPKLP